MNITDELNLEYAKWLKWFVKQRKHAGMCPVLTSGYPPVRGATYVSDIDVNIIVTSAQLDVLADDPYIKDHRPAYITIPTRGDTLYINVRYTTNADTVTRALTHRINEIALASMFPEKVAQVIALKTADVRMNTEEAWAHVFEIKEDPRDWLAKPFAYVLACIVKNNHA